MQVAKQALSQKIIIKILRALVTEKETFREWLVWAGDVWMSVSDASVLGNVTVDRL